MDHKLTQSARFQRLRKLGQQVREVAISRQGDVEGWRVSRLLSDAETLSDSNEAERQFAIWAAGPSANIKMHISTFAARQTSEGWVIDATTANEPAEQLIGLFITEDAAARWIIDHPADWWKLRTTAFDRL